jgi:hypothetical protein
MSPAHVWAGAGRGTGVRMNLDPNLLAVAGIALWLGGAFAAAGVARDWSYDRAERSRLRREAALGERPE